jgi:hypothetical protein
MVLTCFKFRARANRLRKRVVASCVAVVSVIAMLMNKRLLMDLMSMVSLVWWL